METTTAAVKSPPEETSPDRPTRIQKTPLSFTNGVLKLRHHPSFSLPLIPHAPPDSGGAYRECLKNHAAAMGGHAVDGCGEFMAPSLSTSSLLCAACGCHRNFHRRTSENTQISSDNYQPIHRHLPDSPSPPPISSSLYPSSAPTAHMLLALSNNQNNNNNPTNNNNQNNNLSNNNNSSNARRRFRTRFTQAQKDKMFEFAEKLTWKMQRKDEDMINAFCNSIGVEKGVFKVWMHNNKNTLGKRDSTANINNNDNINSNNNNNDIDHHRSSNHHRERNGEEEGSGTNRVVVVVGTNGSSSSS